MPHKARQHGYGVRFDNQFVATIRAYRVSSYSFAEKPIEKVLMVPDPTLAIVATTAEESMPPDRKAPSGTSETRRRRTASSSCATSSPRSSAAGRSRGASEGAGKRQ